MKTAIDIKSAIVGLGLGFLVAIGAGAVSSPISGPVGRYQIAGTGTHGLILDTATGQAWRGYLPADRGIVDPDFFAPKTGAKK
jgi:hypothetical protein